MKMKLILITLCCNIFFNHVSAQEISASTGKIGPFFLEMKQAEIEKICNKKFTINELADVSNNYEKTIEVQVNGVAYAIDFVPYYNDNGEKENSYNLCRVVCKDKNIKTKSGISVGMNKFEVLKKLNTMNIGFEFSKYLRYDNNGIATRTFSEFIKINDAQSGRALTINIVNEVVQSFELYIDEGC